MTAQELKLMGAILCVLGVTLQIIIQPLLHRQKQKSFSQEGTTGQST